MEEQITNLQPAHRNRFPRPNRQFCESLIGILFLIVVLVVSFKLLPAAKNAEVLSKTQNLLDEKKELVTEVTAMSAVSATGIAAFPDDTTTPIANQVANLTTSLVVVMVVIQLEKFIVGISSITAFGILIPLGCILGCIYFVLRRKAFRNFSIKFIVIGLSFYVLIPFTTFVSATVDDVLHTEQTIAGIREETKEEAAEIEEEEVEEEEKGFFSSIADTVSGAFNAAGEAVTNTVEGTVDYLKNIMNQFMEIIAALLLSSFVLPILFMLIYRWIVAQLLLRKW